MTEHYPIPYVCFKSQESRRFNYEKWAIKGSEYEESWDIIAEGIPDEATARFIVTACNCHEVLTNVADAANDLWALFVYNPDEIPYGDKYEQETDRLRKILGKKLRAYSGAIHSLEEQIR